MARNCKESESLLPNDPEDFVKLGMRVVRDGPSKSTTLATGVSGEATRETTSQQFADIVTEKNIGQTVRYYRNGWHFGRMERFDRNLALIRRPDGSRVVALLEDVREV